MQQSLGFPLTPDIAADTGIHLGDGSLFIRQGQPKTSYRYEVTGHAVEDQLYLFGTVIPIISSAYGLDKPGFHLDRECRWVSLRYENKALALFKHDVLGLPNGRKTNAVIPGKISQSPRLMCHLAREILATDGVLGFYGTPGYPHKYARIQIKLTAKRVIEELADFLRNGLGMQISLRPHSTTYDGWGTNPRFILQINRSEDIDTWRKKIGFSNPSHVSRVMVFERLGECPPGTSISDRLTFLSGCSSRLIKSGEIPLDAFASLIHTMKKTFGFPRIDDKAIVDQIVMINQKLRLRLNRELPTIVGLRGRRRDFHARYPAL